MAKETIVKDGMLTIDIETIKSIAHYYEFPFVVFLLPETEWEKKKDNTRLGELLKNSEKLMLIREILNGD